MKHSFVLNEENGLEIKSYFNFTQNDNELEKMVPFLKYLAGVDDVRSVTEKKIEFDLKNTLQNVLTENNSLQNNNNNVK